MLPPAIEQLPSRSQELRELLLSFCHCNSGSNHPKGLLRMAALLESSLSGFVGASLTRIELPGCQAPALSVRMRPQAALRVLCSGHYDTVYDATHPFQSCTYISDTVVRGPGVADMKGGIVVMLAALQAFEAARPDDSIGWEILLTPDEEIGSRASENVIRQAAARNHLALVFEPARANGDIVRSRMGTGVFKIFASGRSAHAAQIPNKGRNAILALCDFLSSIRNLPNRFPGSLLNVGAISGGGPVNVVPDHAEALINIRVSQADDMAPIVAALLQAAAPINETEGLHIRIEGTFDRPPKECGPIEEELFKLYQAGFSQLTLPPPSWQHAGGGSDGNLLSAAGLPNLDGLGIIGENLHSPQESASTDSLISRAQAAALLLLSLRGSLLHKVS